MNYTTAFTKWGLTYHQETTTIQQILSTINPFSTNSTTSTPSTPYNSSLPNSYNISLPNLANGNDTLITKHAGLTFSYMSGKSTYNASVYNERRSYLLSQEQDTVYGITGGWQWQMMSRLNFYLQPVWQSTHSTQPVNSISNATDNSLFQVSMGVTRGIPINLGRPLLLNTTLDLRHVEETSATVGNSYIENRATANFFVQF